MKLSKEFVFILQCIPRALILAVLIILSYEFIRENKRGFIEKILGVIKQKWVLLFLLYFSLIFTSAVFARVITDPFSSVFKNFGLYDEDGINTELIINILVFVPYTFFYLQAFKPKHPFKRIITLSIITTCSIELFQLVLWLGKFQISDIVHNFVGGVIGYALWNIKRMIKERREND